MIFDPSDCYDDSSGRSRERRRREWFPQPARNPEPVFRPSSERLERLERLLLAAELGLAPREVLAGRMTRCGIHRAIIAVYLETGLLFRAEALHEATTSQLVDWHRASLTWTGKTGEEVARCWISEQEYWRLASLEDDCGEDADALAWAGAGADPAEGGHPPAWRRRPR